MAKSRKAHADKIIADLRFGKHDTVILFVPSHDKSSPQVALPDQAKWANRALRLFGSLYGGATAFKALEGVWKDDNGRLLYDQPIMVQSLSSRAALEDKRNLQKLLRFCSKMGNKTNQACVAVIINDVIHYITDFSPP